MFCRRLLQRVAPLTRKTLNPTSRDVSVRHMAFGIPGGSTSMTYFLLCGGGLTAAVVYAYRTVSGDSKSYENRPADMDSATKVSLAEAAPEAAAPTPEPTVQEATSEVIEVEVVAEPARAPAEDTAEAVSEDTADVVVLEALAVAEEAPAEKEAEPEAASVGTEVTAIVEAPAVAEEAPAEKEPEPEAASEVTAIEETPAEDAAAEITGTATLDEIAPVLSTEVEAAPASEVAA